MARCSASPERTWRSGASRSRRRGTAHLPTEFDRPRAGQSSAASGHDAPRQPVEVQVGRDGPMLVQDLRQLRRAQVVGQQVSEEMVIEQCDHQLDATSGSPASETTSSACASFGSRSSSRWGASPLGSFITAKPRSRTSTGPPWSRRVRCRAASAFGADAYPDVWLKAAALL